MKNYLLFESSLKDDWSWNENGDVRSPGGLEHSKVFAAHLPETISLIDGPWNEEDFAWKFLTRFNGIHVSVLVSEFTASDRLVIVNRVVFFGFLRKRRIELAVETVTDAIDVTLRADVRFKNVRRYNQAQFDALVHRKASTKVDCPK